jgi:hypothetical protein
MTADNLPAVSPSVAPAVGTALQPPATVSSDLEAIFAEAPSLRRTGAALARSRLRPLRRGPAAVGYEGRRLSPPVLGGIAAAVLLGVALGALTPRLPMFQAQHNLAVAAVHPVGGPKAAPATIQPSKTEVAVQDKAPAAAQRPARPQPVRAKPRAAAAPPIGGAPDATTRMVAGAGDPQADLAANESCVGAACWPATALVADRRLRAAYERAVQAGVANEDLEYYRDSWAGERRRQADDPARVLERYGQLENDLLREAQKAEGRRSRDLIARVSD